MNEMNKPSVLEMAATRCNDPRTRSRLCKAFVLTVMMLVGIELEAQRLPEPGDSSKARSKRRPRLSK